MSNKYKYLFHVMRMPFFSFRKVRSSSNHEYMYHTDSLYRICLCIFPSERIIWILAKLCSVYDQSIYFILFSNISSHYNIKVSQSHLISYIDCRVVSYIPQIGDAGRRERSVERSKIHHISCLSSPSSSPSPLPLASPVEMRLPVGSWSKNKNINFLVFSLGPYRVMRHASLHRFRRCRVSLGISNIPDMRDM